MTALTIRNAEGEAVGTLSDHAAIAAALGELGVEFERWDANQPLADDADQATVLAAYKDDVEQLNARYGFQSVDVVALGPDHPQKAEMRQKFLAEHTHADFEVRFFVDGSGLFYLQGKLKEKQDVEITIYDILGQPIRQRMLSGVTNLQETANLLDCPDGYYLLAIRLEDGTMQTLPFVKGGN